MVKKFNKLFESKKVTLVNGDSIFHVEEYGMELDEIHDYSEFKDDEIIILYEKNDFKIMLLSDLELFIIFNGWISDIDSIPTELFTPFNINMDKEKFIGQIENFTDVIIEFHRFLKMSYEEVRETPEYKEYLMNKQTKKFKI